jgi:glycosyltransferase involved in cell wall biosynthesis
MLRRERFDVLQVYFPDSTYLGVLVGRLGGVPRIVRTRNNLGYWMKPRDRWLGRLCNRFTHALVANCDACREAFLRDEGSLPERSAVLENGVDLERFPEPRFERPPSRAPRIGIVANLRPVKNLEMFVRAAARVAAEFPDATFHIAGEGELRPSLQALAAQLGIGERFFLPGSIRDVPAFLATLDVGVLCSHSEGMSNALLEYMAAGLAIAATNVGGNAQLLGHGDCGLLVPPGDEAALAQAISDLLRDRTEAERLARAARQRVETNHSREVMVARFQSFFEELTVGGGGR